MHINKDVIHDVNEDTVKARIKAITDDPYNGAEVAFYPGIASVAKVFRNVGFNVADLTAVFDLDTYRYPYQRNEALNKLVAMDEDAQAAFSTMDWFQWFALAHIPEGLWHLVDLPTYYSDDAWLAAYDRALRIAYPMYMSKRDTMYKAAEIRRINEMLNTDANYIIDQVKDHDGCAVGKQQYLEGIQFIDHDLWEDMFSTEYTVTVQIAFSQSIDVTVPGGRDAGEYINDFVSEYEFDLSYESPDDVEVTDYSEA